MEETDYQTMRLIDFTKKYPEYTKFKAIKKFWPKEKRVRKLPDYLLERNKKQRDRVYWELHENIQDKESEIMSKFWISIKEIKKLLNDYTYTEILNWEMVNWKLVVRDLFRVVRT